MLLDVEIETDRLLLRAVRLEDRDRIFEAFTDAVTRYMNPATPKAPAETEAFLQASVRAMVEGRELICAVLERATGELLGCTGVHRLTEAEPELGIWIRETDWGRGYGLEAVRGVLAWASTWAPGAERFLYPVDAANLPSRRLAEALDGTTDGVAKPERTADGRTLNLVRYRVPRAV